MLTEHGAQAQLVQYLKMVGYWNRYPIFAVPNGIWLPTRNQQLKSRIVNRMKAEGMRNGVADVVFLIPRGGYHGMLMELKRGDGGSGLSDDQIEFIKLAEQEGFFTAVPNGYKEAEEMVNEYMSW
jgi:hypothetical protein